VLRELEPIAAATDLQIPREYRRPIAIVGCGGIVDVAHLPAYRNAGLEVVGVYDRDTERARAVASRHDVTTVFGSLDELLASGAEVVDVAVPPGAQADIVHAALAAGKHLLCQKPLAMDVAVAEELVAHAEEVDRKLAVNQQLRFDEGIAAARAMVERGWVGEPTAISFDVDIQSDWSPWPWLMTADRLDLMFHSIHYFDAIRSIFGDPEVVFCAGGRRPGQTTAGETRTMSVLAYRDNRRAMAHVNHESVSGNQRSIFRIDGAEGTIRGTLGLDYGYPDGRPDTLEVFSRAVPTDGWLPYPVTTRWIPDAFAGPMKSLLEAIATDGQAATAGEDNLGTLRLIEALYRSLDSGETQRLPGD
jgi:predicted dehydrogenase